NAQVVVDGEPTEPAIDHVSAAFEAVEATSEPDSLPISKNGAIRCARWLVDNFGGELRAAVGSKPYKVKHLCAIVCQETAYKWLNWINDQTTQTIIERCVFDASGDYPGTSRTAFPRNTQAFRDK